MYMHLKCQLYYQAEESLWEKTLDNGLRAVWHLFMSWSSPIESKRPRPSTHRHALRDTDPTKNPSRCCQAVFLECRNAAVRNQNCHSCRGTVNISYLSVQPFSGNDVTSFLFTETVRFFPRGSPSVDRRSFSSLSEIFFFFQGRVICSGGTQAILKSSCVLTHDLQSLPDGVTLLVTG